MFLVLSTILQFILAQKYLFNKIIMDVTLELRNEILDRQIDDR